MVNFDFLRGHTIKFGVDQTMHLKMVKFEEFPIDSATLFGLVSFLMTPPDSCG